MLNQVSETARKTANLLTKRHPNSVDVAIYRKVAYDNGDGGHRDLQTLGGAMVLTDEDVADYEVELVAQGKMLFLGHLQGAEYSTGSSGLTRSHDQMMIDAYIVAQSEDGKDMHVKKNDRVFWILPNHVIEYQVKSVRSPTNIPPYIDIFELQPLEHEANGSVMP